MWGFVLFLSFPCPPYGQICGAYQYFGDGTPFASPPYSGAAVATAVNPPRNNIAPKLRPTLTPVPGPGLYCGPPGVVGLLGIDFGNVPGSPGTPRPKSGPDC